MLIVRILVVVALVAALAWGDALDRRTEHRSTEEIVEYRLVKWKSTHAESGRANKLAETLRELCHEVNVFNHNGHTDVNYRCQNWQSLALESHREAHQWAAKLKEYGFEAKH